MCGIRTEMETIVVSFSELDDCFSSIHPYLFIYLYLYNVLKYNEKVVECWEKKIKNC
jgi:hypothetical protein